MTSLSDHHSADLVKLLLMGNPKTGKTGSLTSLAAAGYKLRILDYDNLLDSLRVYVMQNCPDKIGNIEYIGLRDKRKVGMDGWEVVGQPKAFKQGYALIDRWKDGETDLGSPADWGPDCILVIDSLSRMSDAAVDWAKTLVPRGRDGRFDGRALVGEAQRAIEPMLAALTAPAFRTNVIVIAHVDYYKLGDGTEKGFPRSPGQKLSPHIASYFPNVVLYENTNGKRTLKTASTPMIDLSTTKPFEMLKEYPIETGLADIFRVLTDPPQEGVTREAAVEAPTTPQVKPQINASLIRTR